MLILCTSCGSDYFQGATFCPSCGVHLQQAQDPLIDRLVGKFKIERRVGDGGCSSVYQARHIEQGKAYAVKVLLPQFTSNEEMVVRFRREAQVLSELQHEHIVEITDFGWVAGLGFYLAMEWLNGETVKDYILRQGPLDKEVVLYLFAQLLDALHTAHQKGVVHRDLKLDNLMLIRGGFGRTVLKVLDFGVAHVSRAGQERLTSTGLVVGTPRYMAPEQVRGDTHAIDNRTDLYSCGLMLLEMLTGQPAFQGDTVQQLLQSQLVEEPPTLQQLHPTGIFGDMLQEVVQRATQKNPEDRYPSALALYSALEEAMKQDGIKLSGHITLPISSDFAAAAPGHQPSFSYEAIRSLQTPALAHTPQITTPEAFYPSSPLSDQVWFNPSGIFSRSGYPLTSTPSQLEQLEHPDTQREIRAIPDSQPNHPQVITDISIPLPIPSMCPEITDKLDPHIQPDLLQPAYPVSVSSAGWREPSTDLHNHPHKKSHTEWAVGLVVLAAILIFAGIKCL